MPDPPKKPNPGSEEASRLAAFEALLEARIWAIDEHQEEYVWQVIDICAEHFAHAEGGLRKEHRDHLLAGLDFARHKGWSLADNSKTKAAIAALAERPAGGLEAGLEAEIEFWRKERWHWANADLIANRLEALLSKYRAGGAS